MTPLHFMLIVFAASIAAGLLGSLLGLGGGIIVVPALTMALGVDIRYAIGASVVAVIATSSGAGSAYVKEHLANIRLAMFLELATTIGALGGAFLAGIVSGRWLYITFGCVMAYTAFAMWRSKKTESLPPPPPDRIADRLKLHGSYHDAINNRDIDYRVTRAKYGFCLSGIAGILSGLLGVGGGVIKVPAMVIGMRVPMKVATATSNFMIGVTAAASAGVYFARGEIDPFVAGPTAMGVLTGSLIGAKLMRRIQNSALRLAFTIVLVIVAFQMVHKGIVS